MPKDQDCTFVQVIKLTWSAVPIDRLEVVPIVVVTTPADVVRIQVSRIGGLHSSQYAADPVPKFMLVNVHISFKFVGIPSPVDVTGTVPFRPCCLSTNKMNSQDNTWRNVHSCFGDYPETNYIMIITTLLCSCMVLLRTVFF